MTRALVVAAVVTVLVLLAGGLLTRIGPWYYALRKPSWQPPDWLFAPAWTLIGVLSTLAAALAWTHRGDQGGIVVALFAINAVLNIGWSAVFFALRRPDLALAEVVLLWLSCLSLVLGLWPLSATAAALLLPYLAWVSFAAFLNLTIVRLNPGFARA